MSCFAKGIQLEFNPDVPVEVRLTTARALTYMECAWLGASRYVGADPAFVRLMAMWGAREARRVQHWLYTEAHESAEAFWACPDCKELLR